MLGQQRTGTAWKGEHRWGGRYAAGGRGARKRRCRGECGRVPQLRPDGERGREVLGSQRCTPVGARDSTEQRGRYAAGRARSNRGDRRDQRGRFAYLRDEQQRCCQVLGAERQRSVGSRRRGSLQRGAAGCCGPFVWRDRAERRWIAYLRSHSERYGQVLGEQRLRATRSWQRWGDVWTASGRSRTRTRRHWRQRR